MKHKVDDKVKVKSLEWYKKNKDVKGDVSTVPYTFLKEMSDYCGKVYEVSKVHPDHYKLTHGGIEINYAFTDEMLETEENSDKTLILSFAEAPRPFETKVSSITEIMRFGEKFIRFKDEETKQIVNMNVKYLHGFIEVENE